MRYVEAKCEEYSRDLTYRIYVTKSLQLIPQSKYVSKDFTDVINPVKVDIRSADEIAIDVIKRAGLTF